MKLPSKLTFRRATLHAKAAPAKDGMVEFTASTPSVDRAGDVLEPQWDLRAYQKNPVILYSHDHTGLPIGKAERIWMDGANLKIEVRFVPDEVYPFAGLVRKLYELGFLSAVSVGFRPLEEPERLQTGGYRIRSSELLEVSAVTVPMNAEALVASKGVGMRPVFSPTWKPPRTGDRAKIEAFLKEGPKMTIDVAAIGRELGVTTNGTDALVIDARGSGTGKVGAKWIVVKADPAPPAPGAAAPAETDCAAMLAQVQKLLTPVEGKIEQTAFDEAMALLAKLAEELGATEEKPPEEEPEQKPAEDMPPEKALVLAVRELTAVVRSMNQNNADPFDLDLDDPIADALADPDTLAKLGRELG